MGHTMAIRAQWYKVRFRVDCSTPLFSNRSNVVNLDKSRCVRFTIDCIKIKIANLASRSVNFYSSLAIALASFVLYVKAKSLAAFFIWDEFLNRNTVGELFCFGRAFPLGYCATYL